jgi:hypothetical protein
MYERFGAAEVGDTGVAEFTVFFPDAALDPGQYTDGGPPRITRLRAIGTFQATPWDLDTGLLGPGHRRPHRALHRRAELLP